jgi:hypothetical protein
MQQMLFRFVRIVPDTLGAGRGAAHRRASHFCAHDALNRMKARACGAPLVFALPGKPRAQRFRDAPSVGISEPGQDGPRGRESECVDELFSEKTQRDRVEQEHALAGERDDPALLGEVQQFVNIEIVGAHGSPERPLKLRANPIILIVTDVCSNLRIHVND